MRIDSDVSPPRSSLALWTAPAPLVLASRSLARRALLAAAGIPFESMPADVDERGIEARLRREGASPGAVAMGLARDKATAVSERCPGRLVLGADQVLALGERTFPKPVDRDDTARQLAALSGRTHVLHSALAVASDGAVLFETRCDARMTMRALSASFVDRYLDAADDPAEHGLGAYRLERLGIHLFERIEGDQSTIMGLPLLPLLAFLRRHGSLAA